MSNHQKSQSKQVNIFQKISFVSLLLCMLFSLSACGKNAALNESTQAEDDGIVNAQSQNDQADPINLSCFSKTEGEYRIQGCESEDENVYVAGYWMLSFFEAEEGPYLSIYDCGAGNPGVEGYIIAMDEESVNVQIDPDYYEELPKANWADLDGILYLQYELTGDGIHLYNGGKETVLEGVRIYPEDE